MYAGEEDKRNVSTSHDNVEKLTAKVKQFKVWVNNLLKILLIAYQIEDLFLLDQMNSF